MTEQKKLVGKDILRSLIPFNSLSEDYLDEISRTTVIEVYPANKILFKKGDSGNYRFYLIKGMVVLEGATEGAQFIKGGSKEACYPLDHRQIRSCTALSKSNVAIIRIEDQKVENFLTVDQSAGYDVDEVDTDDGGGSDWMTRVLQTKSFQSVPVTNIQAVFMRLDAVPVSKGEVIIKQGDVGDHYYIINKGQCQIIKTDENGKKVKVAELGSGDSFGEEALLAEAKRNATVQMVTDGIVMRLSRDDFEELLKDPVLKMVTVDEAKDILKDGGMLIDVRLKSEFENGGIRGSKNIPLAALRRIAPKMDVNKRYVAICDSEQRSRAAAFLLSERGYDVAILEGGLKSIVGNFP